MKQVSEEEEFYRRKIYSVATDNNKLLLAKLWDGKFDVLMSKNYIRTIMLYIIQPLIFLLLYISLDTNLLYLRIIAKVLILIDVIYIFIISVGILFIFNSLTKMTLSQAVLYYREVSPKPFFRIDTIIKILIITALFTLGNNTITICIIVSMILLEASSMNFPNHLYRFVQKDFVKDTEDDSIN